MKLDLTKEVVKMTLDLKEEITKMRLDMGDQFQHLIASINRLKEGFKSFRERLKESRCDHSFEKEHTTGLVKKPQRYYPGAVIVLETTRGIELSTEGEKKPSRFCSRMVSICGIFTIQKSKGLVIRNSSFQRLVHERGGQHLLHETHMKGKECFPLLKLEDKVHFEGGSIFWTQF
ncbi:hypothetical protein YC2023_018770 [Brassica napus]